MMTPVLCSLGRGWFTCWMLIGEDLCACAELLGILGQFMGLFLVGCLLLSFCRTVSVMGAVPLDRRDYIACEYSPTFTRRLALSYFFLMAFSSFVWFCDDVLAVGPSFFD